jgi:hypothetical protein
MSKEAITNPSEGSLVRLK